MRSPNRILGALSLREYGRIRPALRTLALTSGSALPYCGQTRVYFPVTGLCSILNTMVDGAAIEVACIGNEGMVGLNVTTADLPQRVFVQVADGTVQYMPRTHFERELARGGVLSELVDGYSHTFLEMMIQAVACNRLHTFHERCARWILLAHDRLGRARFEVTPTLLARALGTAMPQLEAVLVNLEHAGVLRRDATSVTVLDAIGLRRMSCRCYDAMKHAYTIAVPAVRNAGAEVRPARAKVLSMKTGVQGCTLCGSSLKVPHRTGHDCILALDEEIAALTNRTHILRKYRAQLLAQRVQMFRDIMKRSGSA